MTRREVRRKFDEIVAFAGVEQFLDTPMKFYSSGMFVRLAFSVAALLEPEILIVDEVLSVGDAAFQKKSLAAMRKAATGGCTCLLVSHNLAAVVNLCQRAILLESGRLTADGTPKDVVQRYLTSAQGSDGAVRWNDVGEAGQRSLPFVFRKGDTGCWRRTNAHGRYCRRDPHRDGIPRA